jgi:hypothetical protein
MDINVPEWGVQAVWKKGAMGEHICGFAAQILERREQQQGCWERDCRAQRITQPCHLPIQGKMLCHDSFVSL